MPLHRPVHYIVRYKDMPDKEVVGATCFRDLPNGEGSTSLDYFITKNKEGIEDFYQRFIDYVKKDWPEAKWYKNYGRCWVSVPTTLSATFMLVILSIARLLSERPALARAYVELRDKGYHPVVAYIATNAVGLLGTGKYCHSTIINHSAIHYRMRLSEAKHWRDFFLERKDPNPPFTQCNKTADTVWRLTCGIGAYEGSTIPVKSQVNNHLSGFTEKAVLNFCDKLTKELF